ncbi:hypothetical protein QBC34DRAFT_429301 [Podospora aff. communis PSN243]|uniref:Uncharacterized protein n=1 Tax=Podospora aff. communis PSN243 TaxID=3040156 RepID=A0AAV9G9X0_9PEZI|nr:hypothetical protein QBC34DRAFT_429301 [Podospora aff. communis PSN243]
MLTKGFPYSSLKRTRVKERGLRWVMGCFSGRMLRGVPRLLAYLVGFLAVAFLVLRFVSQELSQAAAETSKAVWHWHTGESWDASRIRIDQENFLGYGQDGLGNFRIVVFGEQDVATPSRKRTGQKVSAWTDVMCEELHCSTYMSYVPSRDNKERSMLSIGLYAQALEEVAKRSGEDFNFQAENYPTAWELPDLDQQITSFLATKAPDTPPRETLWVFTFGTWDMWSLATLPADYGRVLMGQLTDHLFDQIERVYQASLNQSSIAYSDVHGKRRHPAVEQRQHRTDMFRVLIPRLFDPTLTPAWSTDRPDLGDAHPKAEQLRTATILTNEWNDHILAKMDAWVRGPESRKNLVSPAPDAERKDPLAAEKAVDKEDTARELLALWDVAPPTQGTPQRRSLPDPPSAPLRDGFLLDLPSYIIDAMTERQLRSAGLKDGNGVGGKPVGEGFRDVWNSCAGTVGERVCEVMQEHLFATGWTLSARAVRNIGEIAGEMVLVNGTVRRGWEGR